MIRGVNNKGALFIGLVRGELLERLLAGERVCLAGHIDANGLQHPHVCLFLRDNNAQLLAAVDEYFPDGLMPGAAVEQASKDEPR